MPDDPIDDGFAGLSATRKMSVYRLHSTQTLHDLLAQKVSDDREDRFEIREVAIGSRPGLLVSGESEADPPEWTASIRSLTGVDLDFTSSTASAALFIQVDTVNYALTFGHGWRYLRDSKVDRQFGLNVAVRMLDPDDIRQITRWALSAKSRVDRNVVPSGQGLWAFGLREHAELVRNLTGKAHDEVPIDLTYVRRRGRYRNFRLSIECADGLHIPLGVESESVVSDLRELNRIVDEVPVNSRLEPLQWVRRLQPSDDRRAALDLEVVKILSDPGVGESEVGIAYPARYHDGPTVHEYQGTVGDAHIATDELTMDHLRDAIRQHSENERLRVLSSSKIEGFDDSGTTLGGAVSALHWLAAEVVTTNLRAILLDGEWYELGDEYVKHVERVVSDAFAKEPDWQLPPWEDAPRNDDGKVVESAYNDYVARKDRKFLCLDRKLVTTRVHRRGFEACDLLGPNNALIHVKKASSSTGSSVLSHLFAQGLVALESLTDPETWTKFVAQVAKQDGDRAEKLGNRPSELVYAIHRSDKPLRPESLFTFARSALASAWLASTTYGIPMSICVIP